MAQEHPERTKKLREQFAKIAVGIPKTVNDSPRGYPEQLKKIKERLAAIVAGNYSLTPAIVKMAHGRKVEVYFAYNISRQKEILRPYLKLVTDFDKGLILEFKNAYYSEFADAKKYPLNAEFDAKVPVAKSAKEQMALLNELQELYVKVRGISFTETLSDEDKQTLADYDASLSKTVPVELLAFCKDTEPEFFNWVRTGVYSSR